MFPPLSTNVPCFFRAWQKQHVFLSHGIDHKLSRAWNQLHVRVRSVSTDYWFSRYLYWAHSVFALSNNRSGYTFSRSQVTHYPALALVRCFPALGTGNTFSRAWHWLHVFLCLALELGTSYMFPAFFCTGYRKFFPRPALATCLRATCLWQQLHVFTSSSD